MILNELYQQAQSELANGDAQLAALTVRQAARELAAIGVALGAPPNAQPENGVKNGVSQAKRRLDRSEIDTEQFHEAQVMLQTLIDQVSSRCEALEAECLELKKRHQVVKTFQNTVSKEGTLLDLCR
jgi:hypothetical protein